MPVWGRALLSDLRRQLFDPSRTSVSAPHDLLQSRPERHIFQKACQHRPAALKRRGQQHSVRLEAAQFAWSQIRYDHDLAADKSFWSVSFRDAGKNLACLASEVDFQPEQFVCAFYLLRYFHLRHPQLNLGKIVDRNFSIRS